MPPTDRSPGLQPSPAPASAPGGILGWMLAAPPPAAVSEPKRRSRRDSSSLTADEALNISRANARPIEIPRTLREDPPELGAPVPAPSSTPREIPRAKPKYDKLGLIAAFSGGPGSF